MRLGVFLWWTVLVAVRSVVLTCSLTVIDFERACSLTISGFLSGVVAVNDVF